MKIILTKGIDEIALFGMRRPDIISNFGENYREVVLSDVDDDDDERVEWQFDEFETSFRFYDKQDGRLGYIRSSNKSLILFDQKLIGSSINLICDEASKNGLVLPSVENYDISQCISWIDPWIELYTTYGLVRSVNLGVTINDDDSYDWPKEKK